MTVSNYNTKTWQNTAFVV